MLASEARPALIGCLWLLAGSLATAAPESRQTIRYLVGELRSIEDGTSEVMQAVADYRAKVKDLVPESMRTEAAALEKQRGELAGLCSGEHEQIEYDRRKQICDEQLPALNARIDDLARRRQELLASVSPSESEIAASLKALKSRTESARVRARSIAGAEAALATCSGATAPGGWPRCARTALCEVATARAARTRAAIEGLRRELATNRSELDYWGKLNAEAQLGAVEAAAKFWLGQYAANQLSQRQTLEKLTKKAERLAMKAGNAKKAEMIRKYEGELMAVVRKMGPPNMDLLLRGTTKAALDAEQKWQVIRDTFRLEMNTARKNDGELKAILEQPAFRDLFKSSELDSPEHDLKANIAEDLISEVAKHALSLESYEKSFAPHVRAAVFVRDSGYNALLSLLSTQRVLQQADVASSLAKASGVLQEQNEEDVLDALACTAER